MTFAVALGILGIESVDGMTRGQLRRIYMRKLKDHPPERDPDGFRRLREAFDLVGKRVADGPDVVAEPREPIVVQVDERKPEPVVEGHVYPPLPPLAPPPPNDPPMPLRILIPRLLDLLIAGNVPAAMVLESNWRAAEGTDDVRELPTAEIVAQWALLRELMLPAPLIAIPITKLLASAIASRDVSAAQAALVAYRRANPDAATHANGLLVKLAPTIYGQLNKALVTPPRAMPQYVVPPGTSTSTGGTGRALGVIGALVVVVIAIARVVGSSSSGYHPPDYNIKIPKFDPVPPLDPRMFDSLWTPPPLPPETPTTAAAAWDVISSCGRTLTGYPDLGSPDQQRAGALLEIAAGHQSCKEAREQLATLDAPAPVTTASHALFVVKYTEAIRSAIAVACDHPTKPTSKSKPKKPPSP